MSIPRAEEQQEAQQVTVPASAPDSVFDDLTLLASRIAGMPIALVTLVDEDRVWFKARTGVEITSLPRDISFCREVIEQNRELEIADTTLDPRFATHPLVLGPERVRCYAGFPLVLSSGLPVGTLCVIGTEPRQLSPEQRHGLRTLAAQVVTQLEVRRWGMQDVTLTPLPDEDGALVEVDCAARDVTDRTETALELSRQAAFTRAVVDSVDVGIVACDEHGRLSLFNPTLLDWHGLPEDADVAQQEWSQHFDLYAEDGETRLTTQQVPLYRALQEGAIHGVDMVIAPKDRPARRVRCDGQALRDERGNLIGAVVVMADVTAERRALRLLAAERRLLAESQRIGRFGSFDFDTRTGAFTTSDELRQISGVGEDADARAAIDSIHPEDRRAVRVQFRQALREGGRHELGYRIRRLSDGAIRHIRTVVEVGDERSPTGKPLDVHGTYQDVTDVSEAERASTEANAFLNAVITASPDFTFVTDVESGAVVFGSHTTSVGLSGAEIMELGEAVDARLVHPEDLPMLLRANKEVSALPDGEVYQSRFRARHVDGTWRWLSRRVTPFRRDDDGQVTQILGVIRDITETVEAEAHLTHAAQHDHMTGLPNRLLLHEQLSEALSRAASARREVAVLYIDLDGFKRVNDTAGHASGDAVLRETARRITAAMRPEDTIARVGGDEFVVVAEARDRDGVRGRSKARAAHQRSLALTLAERITAAIAEPVSVGDAQFCVTASVGVSFASGRPDAGELTAEQLLQDADTAMYEAKSQGKDRFVVYESGLSAEKLQRGLVEQELRWALAQNERIAAPRSPEGFGFYPVYQPVFGPDGRLSSFEALARLCDRDGGQQPIDLVIRVAEETGLIRPLGTRMLDEALAQLASWRRVLPGLEQVRMAVNVSAVQAQDPHLADEVRSALSRHGLRGTDVILEVTETSLLQASSGTIEALEGLRDDGVHIVLDDFGVGYASLTYLTTLPVTGVKIDRSFTCGLPDSPSKTRIVSAVAALSADLGLTCVAEGVETQEQYAALPAGVFAQGYLFARPGPASSLDLARLLLAAHLPTAV